MESSSETPVLDRGDATIERSSRFVYRQKLATRITHWLWATCFFFLLMSGLQIFNARTMLYLGQQSGFQFDNSVPCIGADETDGGPSGYTVIFGKRLNTDGVLGASQSEGKKTGRGFPSWATMPGPVDLATGRVIHFFFAWLLVGTLLV